MNRFTNKELIFIDMDIESTSFTLNLDITDVKHSITYGPAGSGMSIIANVKPFFKVTLSNGNKDLLTETDKEQVK